MKMNIEQALEKLADNNQKKIDRKYNGDREAFKSRNFRAALEMSVFGKEWSKDGIKRIYFDEWNIFYDYETGTLEKILAGNEMKYSEFEKSIVSNILSEIE